MTTSQIPFTAHSDDDAPSVDANGDPRFVTERDMAEADGWNREAEDERAIEYAVDYAVWQVEQSWRERGWF